MVLLGLPGVACTTLLHITFPLELMKTITFVFEVSLLTLTTSFWLMDNILLEQLKLLLFLLSPLPFLFNILMEIIFSNLNCYSILQSNILHPMVSKLRIATKSLVSSSMDLAVILLFVVALLFTVTPFMLPLPLTLCKSPLMELHSVWSVLQVHGTSPALSSLTILFSVLLTLLAV